MRDRHSPWFNHNLELVLWGLTTFALLILLAQMIRDQRTAPETRVTHSISVMPTGQAPETGD